MGKDYVHILRLIHISMGWSRKEEPITSWDWSKKTEEYRWYSCIYRWTFSDLDSHCLEKNSLLLIRWKSIMYKCHHFNSEWKQRNIHYHETENNFCWHPCHFVLKYGEILGTLSTLTCFFPQLLCGQGCCNFSVQIKSVESHKRRSGP